MGGSRANEGWVFGLRILDVLLEGRASKGPVTWDVNYICYVTLPCKQLLLGPRRRSTLSGLGMCLPHLPHPGRGIGGHQEL